MQIFAKYTLYLTKRGAGACFRISNKQTFWGWFWVVRVCSEQKVVTKYFRWLWSWPRAFPGNAFSKLLIVCTFCNSIGTVKSDAFCCCLFLQHWICFLTSLQWRRWSEFLRRWHWSLTRDGFADCKRNVIKYLKWFSNDTFTFHMHRWRGDFERIWARHAWQSGDVLYADSLGISWALRL